MMTFLVRLENFEDLLENRCIKFFEVQQISKMNKSGSESQKASINSYKVGFKRSKIWLHF